MKLGSKIVLGFLVTNIIYVALSLFIFLSAQPVRKDSTILSQDLLTMLDQASLVQYSTAMEGYMTQEYSHSINAETWVEALTYNADVIKYLNLLEECESITKNSEVCPNCFPPGFRSLIPKWKP